MEQHDVRRDGNVHAEALTGASDVAPPCGRTIQILPFEHDLHKTGVAGEVARRENAELLKCGSTEIELLVRRALEPRSRFFIKIRLNTVAMLVCEVVSCQPDANRGCSYRVVAELHHVVGIDSDRATDPRAALAALLAS